MLLYYYNIGILLAQIPTIPVELAEIMPDEPADLYDEDEEPAVPAMPIPVELAEIMPDDEDEDPFGHMMRGLYRNVEYSLRRGAPKM